MYSNSDFTSSLEVQGEKCFCNFFEHIFLKKKIMNDIEGLSIPQSESDVPVELSNTITTKGNVGVGHRALKSKRGKLNSN